MSCQIFGRKCSPVKVVGLFVYCSSSPLCPLAPPGYYGLLEAGVGELSYTAPRNPAIIWKQLSCQTAIRCHGSNISPGSGPPQQGCVWPHVWHWTDKGSLSPDTDIIFSSVGVQPNPYHIFNCYHITLESPHLAFSKSPFWWHWTQNPSSDVLRLLFFPVVNVTAMWVMYLCRKKWTT